MTPKILNEQFEVIINLETGQTQINVTGSDGRSCLAATKALENALTAGAKNLLTRTLKSEALNKIVTKAKQRVGLG